MDTNESRDEDPPDTAGVEMDEGRTMKRAFLHNFVFGVGLAIAAIAVFAVFGTLIDMAVPQVDLPLLVRVGVGFVVATILRVILDYGLGYMNGQES